MKKDPMKDKKAGVQTMPCVVFALRASNASKAKSNKTNNNFKHMSNSIKFPLSGVEKYLFNKKTKFVVDPSLPEIIFPSEDYISHRIFFSFASNEDYSNCREAGGTVVSNVFCLPTNYRKDVLPPTGGNLPYKFLTKLACQMS